jgi:pilus assembly protein FimV
MLRNLAAALALTLLSQMAMALGLGTLKQSSGLNEPFNARIGILSATAADLETILVRLADAEQFERAGVGRDGVLLQLRFKVVEGSSGADYIQVTSREPIREPFLNFLLELNWAKGRIVREYTVLLDPPLYDPVRRQAPAATPARRTPVIAEPEMQEPVIAEPEMQEPAIAEPEMQEPVIAEPEMQEPAIAEPEMQEPAIAEPEMQEPVIAEPEMQEPEPLPAEPSAQVEMTEVVKEPANVPAPTSDYQDNATLSPVQVNDTLWAIASANVPDQSVSVQQMMLALLRANPDAFGDNNINILKRGAILRLPNGEEIASVSRADAIAEVQRQHQLWNNYRDVALEEVAEVEQEMPVMEEPETPIAAEPEVDMESTVEEESMLEQPPLEEESSGRLELVAPDSDDQMGAGAGADGASEATLAQEELDTQVQENAELQARISEANEIIDLMSRQVDIRDDELAALQSRLVELGIEAPIEDISVDVDESSEDGDAIAALQDDPGDVALDDDNGPFESEIGDVDIDITIAEEAPSTDSTATETSPFSEDIAATDDGGGADPEPGASFLGGLIPDSISSMVPGGAMTVLGIIGAAILAILAILFNLIRGRDDSDDDELAASADNDDVTSMTEGPDDEPITERRAEPYDDETLEDATEFAADLQATSADLQQQTLESSADEQAGVQEPADDPLEEVNVYLAYERFDQAEELVRNVVAKHPEDHNYKLRLLEVFYSSNDKSAYEVEAKLLHEAVGESDPLWDSAVAMWTEMSPERALFVEPAAGAEPEDSASDEANAVVDITAEAQQAGVNTMTMAPGTDAVLESTQVGLGPAADLDEDVGGSLDFDLGASDDDLSGDDGILDLTATTGSDSDESDMFDLTASMDDDGGDILEFTTEAILSEDEMDTLDITSSGDISTDDILDVTTSDPGAEHDLLDVTKTGGSALGQSEDILNVTSPGLIGDQIEDGDGAIDFDISDTIVSELDLTDSTANDDSDVFDITARPDEEQSFDFDIGGLSAADTSDETLDISGGLDFDADATATNDDGLDLTSPEGTAIASPDDIEIVAIDAILPDTADLDEITSSAEEEVGFDLSLESPELDALASDIGDSLDTSDGESEESEIEFDLALEDTTEIDRLVIDDTLELPKTSTPNESLEDLAKSMEESMADLDLGEDVADVDGEEIGNLDLSLVDTSGGLDIDFDAMAGETTETTLDFDLDDIDLNDIDPADTLAMDRSDLLSVNCGDQESVALPPDDSAQRQSDADEVDTKLNLAKAYIELGDNDGARSIIDEVARDGTDDQKVEAQRLIEQLD